MRSSPIKNGKGRRPKLSCREALTAKGNINGKEALGFYFGSKVRTQTRNLGHRSLGQEPRRHAVFRGARAKTCWRCTREKPIVPPFVYDYPGDAISRQLDSMTLEDYFSALTA